MTVTRKGAARRDESIERVLQTMRARFKDMSESQRLLAHYILENPYDIAFTSAAKVGGELGISSATVVRFAGFLGLDGYADLQELARKSVARQVSEVAQFKSMTGLLTGASVLHKGLRADIESIQRTGELLSEATFEKAVGLIATAPMVHVAGFRSNYALAQQFVFNLNLIGRRAQVLSSGLGDFPERLLQMRAGDTCVVISFRRYSAQIRDVIEHAKGAGVPVVALSNSEVSFVAEGADVLLPVAVKYPSILESRVAVLSVITSLMTGVALVQPKKTAESMSRHEAMWARIGTYVDDLGVPITAIRAGRRPGTRARARAARPKQPAEKLLT
jgi:DNA-binding MurR/RpiR family transcriptional regulator